MKEGNNVTQINDDQCRRIADVLGIQPGESFDWKSEKGHGIFYPSWREKFEQIALILQEEE